MTSLLIWSGGATVAGGASANGRIYTIDRAGDRWRWVLPDGPDHDSYQAGAFLSMGEAKTNAENYERKLVEEAVMRKGGKKASKGSKASKANGAAVHEMAAAGEKLLAGHERPGGVERARFVENLPCKMEAVEVESLRGKLVAVTIERVAKEAEKAALSEAIKGLSKREESLCEQLHDEAELRDIDCVERFYVETNSVDTVRLDTGEVIRTRTATAEDRQEELTDKLVDGVLAKAVAGAKKKGDEPPPATGDDDIPFGDDDGPGGDNLGGEA